MVVVYNFEYTYSIIISKYFNTLYIFRFVFMALMEYCLVNIVLGDTALPKPIPLPPPPEPPKPEKTFDYAPPKVQPILTLSDSQSVLLVYLSIVLAEWSTQPLQYRQLWRCTMGSASGYINSASFTHSARTAKTEINTRSAALKTCYLDRPILQGLLSILVYAAKQHLLDTIL